MEPISLSAKQFCHGEPGIAAARCTVARLMQAMGLQGVMKTTINDQATPGPLNKVNRQFAAERPNKLEVSNFTDVAT